MPDLGRRIRAARAHAGISRATLAESLSFSPGRLERLESGLDEPTGENLERVVEELAKATRVPERFFTGDFHALD
jgi:transcriptional regulator with XRE-family HTH domain